MTDHIDHILLASYLAGECTDAESERVRLWLASSPDNTAAFREFEAVWRAAPRAAVAWNADAAWQRVQSAFRERPPLVLAPAESAVSPYPAHRFALARSRMWVAAAVAALVMGASAVILNRLGSSVVEQAEPLPMREIATAKGQRTSMRLSDGTQVVLGVDSKLLFSPVFGVTARDVYLEGEAFFDVAPDPDKPFTVHAAGSVTRVLGTRFGFRAYAGEPDVRVVVSEGKVQFRPKHAEADGGAVLTRNQVGRLESDGRISVRRDVNVQSYLGWVDGKIDFSDAPLREVVRELEHWYDADFALADAGLDTLRLTVVFDQEPLDVVVRTIVRTLDLEHQRIGSAIVFSHRPRVDR